MPHPSFSRTCVSSNLLPPPQVALLRKLRNRHIVEFIGCSWTRSSLDDSAKPGAVPDQLFYVQEYCECGGSMGLQAGRQLAADLSSRAWAEPASPPRSGSLRMGTHHNAGARLHTLALQAAAARLGIW